MMSPQSCHHGHHHKPTQLPTIVIRSTLTSPPSGRSSYAGELVSKVDGSDAQWVVRWKDGSTEDGILLTSRCKRLDLGLDQAPAAKMKRQRRDAAGASAASASSSASSASSSASSSSSKSSSASSKSSKSSSSKCDERCLVCDACGRDGGAPKLRDQLLPVERTITKGGKPKLLGRVHACCALHGRPHPAAERQSWWDDFEANGVPPGYAPERRDSSDSAVIEPRPPAITRPRATTRHRSPTRPHAHTRALAHACRRSPTLAQFEPYLVGFEEMNNAFVRYMYQCQRASHRRFVEGKKPPYGNSNTG